MSKGLVLAIAMAVFLVGYSNPEAIAGQRGGAPSGNVAVATNYYEDNLSKCGDSHIAQWTLSDRSGSGLVELKGVRYNASLIPLSQADRLNGLEDAFESWIQPTAARITRSPRDNWDAWRDEKTVFRFRFHKVKGNWTVSPVPAGSGGISGYLAKYPCDDVPGHPARSARERKAAEDAADTLATVNDRIVRVSAYRRLYEQQVQALGVAYGTKLDEDKLRQLGIAERVFQEMIESMSVLAEATRLGINVSDEELTAKITQLPTLTENGRFIGDARYRDMLQRQTPPLSDGEFREQVRAELMRERLTTRTTDGARVTDSELDEEVLRRSKSAAQSPVDREAVRSELLVKARNDLFSAYMKKARAQMTITYNDAAIRSTIRK